MKKIFYLIAISSLSMACGGGEENNGGSEETTETVEVEGTEEDLLASNTMDPRTFGGAKHDDQNFIDGNYPAADPGNDALGSYAGAFGKNMINITLYQMADGKAEGYSVCAGNFRKISGTYKKSGNGEFDFVMEEPGDDQYDGKFEFTLNTDEDYVTGKWTPFQEKGTSAKNYTLAKREFKYDPKNGKYPEASQRELTDADLNNLSEDELTEMRNEIYARHGYSFKNKDWRYHFEKLDWYMPMGIDIRDKLTDIEAINIELIYEYESYFEEYYDDYGR